MLSVKRCFEPQFNSMAPFVELSREAMRQEALQKIDHDTRPYDVLGWGGDDVDSLPECLTVMDYLFNEKKMV